MVCIRIFDLQKVGQYHELQRRRICHYYLLLIPIYRIVIYNDFFYILIKPTTSAFDVNVSLYTTIGTRRLEPISIGGAGWKWSLASNSEQWNSRNKWSVSMCVCLYGRLLARVSLCSPAVRTYVCLYVGAFARACVCLHDWLSLSLSTSFIFRFYLYMSYTKSIFLPVCFYVW